MKNFLNVVQKSLFTLLFCTSISSCANKEKKQAAQYNDTIVSEVDRADSLIRILLQFDMFHQYPQFEKDFNYTFAQAKSNLQKLTPIANDDSLRQAALQLIDTYTSVLNNDYAGIYKVMKDSAYTATDSARVDSLMSEMYAKWQIESERIASLQKRFAERHAIVLEE